MCCAEIWGKGNQGAEVTNLLTTIHILGPGKKSCNVPQCRMRQLHISFVSWFIELKFGNRASLGPKSRIWQQNSPICNVPHVKCGSCISLSLVDMLRWNLGIGQPWSGGHKFGNNNSHFWVLARKPVMSRIVECGSCISPSLWMRVNLVFHDLRNQPT